MGGAISIKTVRGYSIWLTPEEAVSKQLDQIIQDFSKRTLSPTFPPHLTLLGQIDGEEDQILEGFESLQSAIYPMSIHLSNPEMQDSYFRSLYLQVLPQDEITRGHELVLKQLQLDRDPAKFFPHVSLLYSDLPLSSKRELLSSSGHTFDYHTSLDRIVLMKTHGSPDHWEVVSEYSL